MGPYVQYPLFMSLLQVKTGYRWFSITATVFMTFWIRVYTVYGSLAESYLRPMWLTLWLLGTLTNWFWAVFAFNINIDLRNSCNEVRVNETVKRVDSEYKRAPLRESDTLHIKFVYRFCHTILNREREKERDGERDKRERERRDRGGGERERRRRERGSREKGNTFNIIFNIDKYWNKV